MVSETCNTCGLPDELCVCEDVATVDSGEIVVEEEERQYGKKATMVKRIPDGIDKSNLASELKSRFACGGTVNDNGNIMLQGEHREGVVEYLKKNGFSVEGM